MSIAMAVTLALIIALAPRIWWLLVGLPRYRARCETYVDHAMAAWPRGRCHCVDCVKFRDESGWPP